METSLKSHLDVLEQRVTRLLSRDEQAFTAALPLVGILAHHGRPECMTTLRGAARRLKLDLDATVLERLRECRCDLHETTAEDSGISLAEAQGLILTCHFLAEFLQPETTRASADLAEDTEAVSVDGDAVGYLERWQAQNCLAVDDPSVLAQVALPLSAGELEKGSALCGEPNVDLVNLQSRKELQKLERALAEVGEYGELDLHPPEPFREALNTDWIPVKKVYGGQLSLSRILSQDWLFTMYIRSPVPVRLVRYEHHPFKQDVNRPEVWHLDLKPVVAKPGWELGRLPVQVVFADGLRLKVI